MFFEKESKIYKCCIAIISFIIALGGIIIGASHDDFLLLLYIWVGGAIFVLCLYGIYVHIRNQEK